MTCLLDSKFRWFLGKVIVLIKKMWLFSIIHKVSPFLQQCYSFFIRPFKRKKRIAYKRWFIIFYSYYYIFKKRPKMLMVWLVPIHCSLVRMPELFNSTQILDKIWIAEKTVILCTGPLNTYMVLLNGTFWRDR